MAAVNVRVRVIISFSIRSEDQTDGDICCWCLMNTILLFLRFGGLRGRRVLETHSRSLEETPYYRDDGSVRDNVSVGGFSLDNQHDWEHRSWCSAPVAPGHPPGQGWSVAEPDQDRASQHQHHNNHHRRLPQTPRRPSTLLSMQVNIPGQQHSQNNNSINAAGPSLLNQHNIQQHNLQNQQPQINQQQPKSTQSTTGSIFDKVSNFKQSLLPTLTQNLGSSLPAGTPQSFGVNSNLTVKSERNDRDQFTRSGPNPNFVSSMANGSAQQNGFHSSQPNLQSAQTQTKPVNNNNNINHNKQHRQLPAVPKQASQLKMSGMWRQSSLPEQCNPPGHGQNVPPPAPTQPPQPQHRRYKPVTPTKPSTLSLRQSYNNHLNNGTAAATALNYSFFGPGHSYQMPKLNCSPSSLFNSVTGRTDTMVHFNGINGSQHRTLPPTGDRRLNNGCLGRTLPLPPPPPPAPSSPTHKQNGGLNGLSGVFQRSSQEVDWIWSKRGAETTHQTINNLQSFQTKSNFDKSYERNLLDSIKLQYLQLAEWECQALADEAKYGAGTEQQHEQESKPRKVVYNSREEVWDFRTDINLPWLSRTNDSKNPSGLDKTEFSSGAKITNKSSNSDLMLASSLISRNKNENSTFKIRNFENDFVWNCFSVLRNCRKTVVTFFSHKVYFSKRN